MDSLQTQVPERMLIKCARYWVPFLEGAPPRLLQLPCELITLIFRCPVLHQFERVHLGRTCRQLHELRRRIYPFPTRTILDKSIFFTSIASYLLELEAAELPSAMHCNYNYSYCNAMTTWLLPFRVLIVSYSWVLRMISFELDLCISILRRLCTRSPTITFAIVYILHKVHPSSRGWVSIFTRLLQPIGRKWSTGTLFMLIRAQWAHWSPEQRGLVIRRANRNSRFDLANMMVQIK